MAVNDSEAYQGSGKVIAVNEGAVLIDLEQNNACDSCSLKQGCGHSFLSQKLKKNKSELLVSVEESSLHIGDKVAFEMQEDMVLKAAIILYLPALILFILGAVLGLKWGATEVWSILGSILGLFLGLFATYCLDKWFLIKEKFQPYLIKK